MWKPEHRVAGERRGLRYPSDMNDSEWTLIAALIPPARRGGRPRDVNLREVLNAIFYVLATGCQWQALPKDLPPKSTAHHYFMLWDWDGTLERIHEALYVAVREAAGREASPTAAIIDSQTAKAAQKGGSALDPQGYDAGKKDTGRKRHILVDTLGLLLGVSVLPANIQDRDGASDLLREARRRFPFVERIFADAGYQGPKMAKVAAGGGRWKIEIVKRSDPHRFVVLPKRWVVERSLAWISRNRRLMRDFECYAATVAAFVRLAMIRLMLKRLTKPSPCS
ncbi:IS5 family transposase (plasmid) [Methylocapsa polymorpha]|uniref:IS5 family transposase n=1 Tax=Methylocapsa polymorpha TaxID=3080828 RepID=A0ABZ0HY24_9HYPH|nr:IS5 family transposase [Methylocapsa sp. RX1]WOJ91638.1 IS5 family transposase [Methylocapsa sp. RX1]